jgi:dipeptidyl-peptidase-4
MKIIKLYTTILLIFVLTIQYTFAQVEQLNPYNITTNRDLYPENIWILEWIPGTNDIAYSQDFQTLIRKKYPNGITSNITSVSKLNNLIEQLNLPMEPLRMLPSPEWIQENSFRFIHNRHVFLYNVLDSTLKVVNVLDENTDNIDICPNTHIAAYTKGNNLFISVDGQENQVTFEEQPDIVMCRYVHREEFGIKKGSFWSPKGNYLAFYRMDESMVTDYPIVNIQSRIAEHTPVKYPMAGMSSHHVTLGIYNIQKQTLIYVSTGEPADQYLTSVTWSPDEKHIFIGLLNREQNHLKLNMYNANSGVFEKTLFEELSEKYVEPQDPLFFIPNSNERFIWFSQRDGFRHLYLYNTNGKLEKQLTNGNWIVNEIIGFDNNANMLFFSASKESPIEKHIYTLHLKNGKIRKMTNQAGTHHGKTSYDGNFFVVQSSSMEIVSQTEVIDKTGKSIDILVKNNNHLAQIDMPETEIFTLKTKDGIDLYCRLIKPLHFNSEKKYPVIVYVYGGPHAQLITNSWLAGAGLFLNYLAQEGYIVFTLDNRGSANRGFDFETAIFRNIGEIEMQDQMTGIEYLKTLSFVDQNRIGVHGWSYGGYLAMNLMLTYPDVFSVGVAGGPVTDWKYYEVMYGERYMGTPENNPRGYENSSLLNKVDNLHGKLLIIHGAIDPVVVWQHSLVFKEACIKARKQIDYFVYPTHEHNVRGRDRGHLQEKIFQYFKDYL